MSGYWEPIEKEWKEQFNSQMAPYFNMVEVTHTLVAELAQHPEIIKTKHTNQELVERLLLRRLGEELRAVDMIAQGGHGYQAISAASNLFEQSHMLTYVTSDDAIAEKYLGWSHKHKSFVSVKDSVIKSGEIRSWQKDRIDEEYDKYRLLCSFKHNNPMFLRLLNLGDDCDLYLCQLAISDACWFTLTTIGLVAMFRFSSQVSIDFITQINSAMDTARNLVPTFPLQHNRSESGTSE